jgi:hypothetical protein
LVFFAFIAFRLRDLDQLSYSMEKFVFIDFQTNEMVGIILQNKISVALLFLFIILHIISYKKSNLVESVSNLKLRYWTLFIMLVIGAIFYLYDANPDDFIYFRF